MESSIKEWFGSGLKIKRWIFLIIIGVLILSYGIANIISLKTMEINDLIIVGVSFVLGLTLIVISFIMAQRRMLQAIAESNNGLNQRNLNIKKLLFDKKMLDRSIKIVVIGEGTGLSTILKGLKIFSKNITAIVSTMDNQIDLDNFIDDNKLFSSSDIINAIIALSNEENIMKKLMTYNFKEGDIKGYNFYGLLLSAMNEISDDNLASAIKNMSEILSITGKVLPVTLDKIRIGAVLNDETRAMGIEKIMEKVIERESSIEKLFLSPERCMPAPDVIRSIKEADVIIMGPGSLYKGIIPNLLIKEISDEIRKSKKIKILVSNIMSEHGQTDNYTVSDVINSIHEHVGKGIIDYCIATDSDIMPEYIRKYNKEGADILEVDKTNIKATGVNLIVEDLAVIDEKGNIRHDSLKLAKVIMKVIENNLNLDTGKQALEYFTIKSKIKSMENKDKKKSILFRNVKIVKNNIKKQEPVKKAKKDSRNKDKKKR